MISIHGPIPIKIHPSFWIVAVLIAWINSGSDPLKTAIWCAVVLISILIHEGGHALTALAFGQKVQIELLATGGVTQREGPAINRWKEFLIVLNGPLAGFGLFFLVQGLSNLLQVPFTPLVYYALKVAVEVNLFWTLVNLLPVIPLDGGHLLRIALEGAFGIKGLKIALLLSLFLAGLITVFSLFSQQVFLSALFIMMAFENFRVWSDLKGVTSVDQDEELKKTLHQGLDKLKRGNRQEAFVDFVFIRQQAPKGMLYVLATEYAAHILAEQGQYKQAYDWLFPLKNRLSADYLQLLHQLAYRVQEWEQTVKIGQQAYQKNPLANTALINALSHAIMGEANQSLGWLRCAKQQGLGNLFEVLKKREFDTVRQMPEFVEWLKNQKES